MTGAIDLSLYLVTDTQMCAGRGVVETVRAAVAGGVTAVQVRDPDASGSELFELVLRVRDVIAGSGVALLVNDRVDVAMATEADGVHLGQSDLPVEQARRLVGPEMLIGWSVSSQQELAAAQELPAATIDYLGIGPVFDTPTKPNAATATGLDGLRQLTAASTLPVVAIGGIHAHNAADIASTGVSGICVVSEICAADDPEAAAVRLREVKR